MAQILGFLASNLEGPNYWNPGHPEGCMIVGECEGFAKGAQSGQLGPGFRVWESCGLAFWATFALTVLR